jgi:hypothetical protein
MWPRFPLCFVDQTTENEMFIEHIGKDIHPIPVGEVLLIPYFSAYSGEAGGYERVVARPFVYRPQTPVPNAQYRPGYTMRGVVAVCPGYLPSDVAFGIYYTDQIGGTTCQLVDIAKPRNEEEARRVLLDFKYLFSQKQVILGKTRNPLEIREDEEHAYALSTRFTTPTDYTYVSSGRPTVYVSVWNYKDGTRLSVDLTAEEIRIVNGFFDRHLNGSASEGHGNKGQVR